MVVWSSLSTNISRNLMRNVLTSGKSVTWKPSLSVICKPNQGVLALQVRQAGHGPATLRMRSSDWQWDTFKNLVHFYFMVGIIPVLCIVFYCNVFIGPATLAPIPEGYEPKEWEYYKHPITRFLARYIVRDPRQEYEKWCHELYETMELVAHRKLENKVKDLMAERMDYQAWFFRPIMAKYARRDKEFFTEHPYII